MLKKIAYIFKSYFQFISRCAEVECLAYFNMSKILSRKNKIK